MENSQVVYMKNTRKFHDAWAFILYLIVYTGCTTYAVLNIKESSVSFKFLDEELRHAYVCLAIVMLFIIMNFGALRLIPSIYLKIMICLFPVTSIYISIKLFGSSAYISTIFSTFLWCLFMFHYWSNIDTIAGILKITMGILLSHIFSVIFGIIVCCVLQITQLYLTIQLNIRDLLSNRLLFVLMIFNTYWSFANFVYFYKVYATSLVSYHYINRDESKSSVFKGSIKNSFYALGSISFAGFIMALIYTAKTLAGRDKDEDRDLRSKYTIEEALMNIISYFFGVVIEVAELVHDLTLPYLAIHGESYVQSIKNAYQVYTENPLPFGGLMAVNYSLHLSSFLVYVGCYRSFAYTLDSLPQTLNFERLLRLVILAAIPLVIYFTTVMIITSSFLGLLYFNIENPDLVKDINPEMEVLAK